jgi:lipopolysaccharide export system permease protein
LLKVALDIHQILMLKNKIYNYFFNEILKNFITILITFTAIAWVVRAVNFLDLMVEDGYGSLVYFKYTLLNITNILTRFVPIAFLLSLTISIVKFERQQELIILWSTGLGKIKIVNIFILFGFFVTIFQLLLSLFINPYLLNKSRSMLSDTGTLEFSTVLRSNEFSDAFKGLTFYIGKKSENNELQNIFIKDVGGNLNTLVNKENEKKKNSTILAKKGFIVDEKLILFNGMIQGLNLKNEIKNIEFEKTELTLKNISTRTIKQPKIQETSSVSLINCVLDKDSNLNFNNCSKNNKLEAIQTLSRRIGMPLYIPLISIITSFLLIYKKEKKYNFLDKYYLFFLTFVILVFAEILLKFTGFSFFVTTSYFALPVTISFIFYIYLVRKMKNEKIMRVIRKK